ncbi:MAG: B12-binding domain-containing radical SAM protein [Myxococcota bacterium]
MSFAREKVINLRLQKETGTQPLSGDIPMVLIYPAHYGVGMASCGFLHLHSKINSLNTYRCERAFWPDYLHKFKFGKNVAFPVRSYESLTPVNSFPLIGASLSWEYELAQLLSMLISSEIEPLSAKRDQNAPLLIAGGVLSRIAPSSLAPFFDLVFPADNEDAFIDFLNIYPELQGKKEILQWASQQKNDVWAPLIDNKPPSLSFVSRSSPAITTITTPAAQFGKRILVETVKGCSRNCSFCVMSRRATGKKMEAIPAEKIFAALQPLPEAVGLVGPAVSDHPRIKEILQYLTANKVDTSLSSLRADRLDREFVELLARSGYKTLTIAADGSSQRLRNQISKGIFAKHLIRATEFAKQFGINRIKLYQMVGLPGETAGDLEELCELSKELSSILPLVMTISPFVPKPATPLENANFSSRKKIRQKLKYIQKELRGKVEIKPVSWKAASFEYYLDTTGEKGALLLLQALKENWSFAQLLRMIMKL